MKIGNLKKGDKVVFAYLDEGIVKSITPFEHDDGKGYAITFEHDPAKVWYYSVTGNLKGLGQNKKLRRMSIIKKERRL